MIFRRIKAHVAKEDWFAVFIDFIIVVFGVFMGLQVANWSDERGDRARETQVLHEIAADIQSDRVRYSGALNSALNRIAVATYVLHKTPDTPLRTLQGHDLLLEGSGYVEAIKANEQLRGLGFNERIESFKPQLWMRIWYLENVEPSTTAFDSLVSSGELGILQDEGLVRSLQQYQNTTALVLRSQNLTFRPIRDSGIKIGQQFGLSAFGRVDEDAFIELVSTNAHLAAAIQTQLGWSKGHFLFLTIIDNSAAELLTQIEDKLGISLDGDTTEAAP